MVEGVEHFPSKFKMHGFAHRNGERLLDSDVPVVNTGTIKDITRRVAVVTTRRGHEATGVKPAETVSAQIIFQTRAASIANAIGAVSNVGKTRSVCCGYIKGIPGREGRDGGD